MNRADIIQMFRTENPEITDRVISDALLHDWCLIGNKEICAATRCIVDKDGTTISTTEDDQSYDLTVEISNFYDIDEYPGGGVAYNDKRLVETTIASLDKEQSSWRTRTSGTPRKYYRRGPWLFLDRPIDSEADDITIYSVLLPDDFNNDSKTPFNEQTHLEPFHYSLVLFLQKKAKMKVSKQGEEGKAVQEYSDYVSGMKRMLGGGKYAPITFERKI